MAIVKRENWKGRYVYVAREGKKIISRVYATKTKQKKEQLQELLQKQGSFNEDFKTKREKLKNVELVERKYTTTPENRTKGIKIRPPNNNAMYSVEGYVNGERIVANSMKDSYISPAEKKKDAWQSFLERVAQYYGGDYDADEGVKYLSNIKNLREGWVSYAKI